MTKVELDTIAYREKALQQQLKKLSEQPDGMFLAKLAPAISLLSETEATFGTVVTRLLQAHDPVDHLWRWLFAGSQAIYLRFLRVIRMADGFPSWADSGDLIVGTATAPLDVLLLEHIGRSAAFVARWQCQNSEDALGLAYSWANERYRLSANQRILVESAAKRVQNLLSTVREAEAGDTVEYTHRLAIHHRLRMLFVELAGLTLIAHLLTPGGLLSIDPVELRESWRQKFNSQHTFDSQEERWKLYRWFASTIQHVYQKNPDHVFVENAVSLRNDLRRHTIADMVNGPFFTYDSDLARDQSNLHWSRNGLGRDEENAYFQDTFTKGIFRCAGVMQKYLSDQIAAWVIAAGSAPTYIYDGATGAGAIARKVQEAVEKMEPSLCKSLHFQLADVSAESLWTAWKLNEEAPIMFIHQADLGSPLISQNDYSTFDVVGQNLGGHHLPDAAYAEMIRGFVKLVRPGGLIYLGDVDKLMDLQVLNGLWANQYAVEWPRTSPDPYRMFSDPTTLAIPCQGMDYYQLDSELKERFAPENDFKLMISIPELSAYFPTNVPFYSVGFGYVTIVTQGQLEHIGERVKAGNVWDDILNEPGNLSYELGQRQAALMARMQTILKLKGEK